MRRGRGTQLGLSPPRATAMELAAGKGGQRLFSGSSAGRGPSLRQRANDSTGGGPCGRVRGGSGRIKGCPGVADAASAVQERGRGCGGRPAPERGSVALAGERRGRGNRPQCPAEAPAPPLQPLPPHSPASSFLFRSLSAPVSMVTASGRSRRRCPLYGRSAPSLYGAPAVGLHGLSAQPAAWSRLQSCILPTLFERTQTGPPRFPKSSTSTPTCPGKNTLSLCG